MAYRPLRLSTRLGINHGVLVALLMSALLVTLQGLIRMLGVITEIRDQHLSSIDTEEEVHRAAWEIEVGLRRGRQTCYERHADEEVRGMLSTARERLKDTMTTHGANASLRLVDPASRCLNLANALATSTCAFLLAPEAETRRAELDEELTDAWIDRLQELYTDLSRKEDKARGIGTVTAAGGLAVATVGAIAAFIIARSTARSISEPMRRLAADARRMGEGDFAPIPEVDGPLEVEELWRDLEGARERLQELDRLKQSFIANVSHELRSPLARMREGLGLLSDGTCGPLSEQQERVLSIANRACEREVQLVDTLLDMSRLSSGVPAKRVVGCRIDRIVEAALDGERTEARERGVTLEFTKEGSVPLMDLDATLIERAVANLVRNAVSISRAEQTVTVARNLSADGARVLIDVVDRGPGFSTAARSSVFRPFSAAPVPDVGRPAGIGLGLSFAREVAVAHAGTLAIHKSDSSGTQIRLELPIEAQKGHDFAIQYLPFQCPGEATPRPLGG